MYMRLKSVFFVGLNLHKKEMIDFRFLCLKIIFDKKKMMNDQPRWCNRLIEMCSFWLKIQINENRLEFEFVQPSNAVTQSFTSTLILLAQFFLSFPSYKNLFFR